MKTLFDNPKPVLIAIIAIIVLFSAYKCYGTELELGAAYTSQFNGGMGMTLSERVFDNKIDLGIALVGDQDFNNKTTPNNGNFWFAYVATKPESWWKVLPTEVSIGGAYWIKTDERIIGCHQGYMLGIKYRITEMFSVGVRHWSNAGVCDQNRGQDLLTFGILF